MISVHDIFMPSRATRMTRNGNADVVTFHGIEHKSTPTRIEKVRKPPRPSWDPELTLSFQRAGSEKQDLQHLTPNSIRDEKIQLFWDRGPVNRSCDPKKPICAGTCNAELVTPSHEPHTREGYACKEGFEEYRRDPPSESVHRGGPKPYQQDLNSLDILCLLLGQTICMPIQWFLLQSLHPQRLSQNLLCSIASTILPLSSIHLPPAAGVALLFLSTTLTFGLLVKPVARISVERPPRMFVCCLLAFMLAMPLWTYIGGSAAEFFVVFMPFALMVGVSIGFWWQRLARDEHRQLTC